eukprot:TRINITY_DN33082_c0_g1_i1.p1 TRINITY_DN33082_c0_g1~~TRINITY_DN33082_c0_g1_i1.p1  ORF type:complete len:410 (+),score=103.34 TRINITY_DN33082_c0_g1_i1:60-1289(+)
MFILHASADIHGRKCNRELKFTQLPTIEELQRKINNAFTIERKLKRVAGHPLEPFVAGKVLLFDDAKKKWTRVVNPGQLREWCQLFVVPAGQADATDEASKIPKATYLDFRKARDMWDSAGKAGGYHSYMHGVAGRAHTIFKRFDSGQKGFLTQEDFLKLFAVNDTGLGRSSIFELFAGADADHDGRVSWHEFIPFFENYPRVMEAVYQRTLEYWNEREQRAQDLETFDVGGMLDAQREKNAAAQHVYSNALRELDQLEAYVVNQAQARGAPPVPGRAEEESERQLLERHRFIHAQRQKLEEDNARLYRDNMAFCDRHGRVPGGAVYPPDPDPYPGTESPLMYTDPRNRRATSLHPPPLVPHVASPERPTRATPGSPIVGNPHVALAMANQHARPTASPGAVDPSSYFR